jgi:hypothetical protein
MEDFANNFDLFDKLLNNDLSNNKRKELLKQTIDIFKKYQNEIDINLKKLEKMEKELLNK